MTSSGMFRARAEPGLRPLGTETIHAFLSRPSQKAGGRGSACATVTSGEAVATGKA